MHCESERVFVWQNNGFLYRYAALCKRRACAFTSCFTPDMYHRYSVGTSRLDRLPWVFLLSGESREYQSFASRPRKAGALCLMCTGRAETSVR